jgi:hypothetical protein
MPKDGGVYDLPHVIEADGREDGFAAVNDVETPIPVPMGQDAANAIDPAIQGNDFPVDSYTSKTDSQFPVPLS